MTMRKQSRSFSSRIFFDLTLILVFIVSMIFVSPVQTVHAAGSQLKVIGRFLQDANGNNIMMRGVNIPVYKSGWADDLDNVAAAVASTKINVVRLEWWAVPAGGTTQYTVANLDRAIQKYADLGILPIVELHDLTFQYGHDAKTGPYSDGNDQALFASTITNFWTRADVLPILIKHEKHLVINLANEWGSSTYSDSTSTAANFIQNYTNAISAMRTAGINAPLMVDAPKGFEYQFILTNGQAILDADPQNNIMLSVHAYWAASDYTDAAVNTILNNIKNSGLPIILGEVSSNAYTTIQCDPINYANLLTTANTNQIGYLIWAWYEDGQCGLSMNMTMNADGVTIPTSANPGFGYNVLKGSGYGIETAAPTTTEVVTALAVNTKVLTPGRAIASWPTGIPVGQDRPVLVFLPGWGGSGAVGASVSSQNLIFVDEGYVTLAIGFDSSAQWYSDVDLKTKEGLDKLCADVSIPADCSAIALIGESYGGAQNYWVMEYLRSHGYDGGVGSVGRALAFLSEDAGYAAPGSITDNNTGAFTRTGLADTSAYSVAMIENLGDTTFPVDDCTWGNCGARVLSEAHLARGDTNVFSICPAGGEHGTRGFAQWNEWAISAIKTMIHNVGGVAVFTGYTAPTLVVGNACNNSPTPVTNTFTDVPLTYWANGYIERLFAAGITGGCGVGIYCPDATVTRAQMAVFLLKGMHGKNFIPPAVGVSTGFADVPVGYWADKWIKQLAAEGITGGCGVGIYCPDATVTRAQMAVFLLKGEHGSGYNPPAASGLFSDVPVAYWADKWIEQLAAEGVTSGCGAGIYCPDAEVTRAQMAVFLVKTFNLP